MAGCAASNHNPPTRAQAPRQVTVIPGFDNVPVFPGARLVSQSATEAVYMLRSGDVGEVRDFYASEMPRRGWRLAEQIGSVTVYMREDGERVLVGATWKGSDVDIGVSRGR